MSGSLRHAMGVPSGVVNSIGIIKIGKLGTQNPGRSHGNHVRGAGTEGGAGVFTGGMVAGGCAGTAIGGTTTTGGAGTGVEEGSGDGC